MARVVNIQLGFMDWIFFSNLVVLNRQCKIPYKYLDKALLLSRNQVFCLENRKLWRASTTIDINNFCWHFAHVSYLPMYTKGRSGFFFLFCLELELFAKIKKGPGFYPLTGTRFINNSRSKQNKKNPEHLFLRNW